MRIKLANICLSVALFLVACGESPVMVQADLGRLNLFTGTNNGIPVYILEKFESARCQQHAINANVYKVKLVSQEDTIFVFDICNDFWREKAKGLFVVSISAEGPSKFYIPASCKIPIGSKYLIGNLKRVKY